jgi:F420-dependent oxidoreductase-like protein
VSAHAELPVRVGIHSGQQNATLEQYYELWDKAEEAGLEWASVFDHFLPIFSDPTGPCFDGLTLLSALAERTTNVRCGNLVVSATYRHPAVLAKIATTIDHVSGGRLELGLGAGWFELEHEQYGIPFWTVRERLERLRETVQILKSLWTESETTFEGKHFQLKGAYHEPKPVQQDPHPPIWIGGSGERVLLRIVAEFADGWNVLGMPLDDYRHKVEVLEQHCRDVGRDPKAIRRSFGFQCVLDETEEKARGRAPATLMPTAFVGTSEQLVERFQPYLELGARDFLLLARPPVDPVTMELFAGEVAPALRALV